MYLDGVPEGCYTACAPIIVSTCASKGLCRRMLGCIIQGNMDLQGQGLVLGTSGIGMI